jgi:acyl dehydratase
MVGGGRSRRTYLGRGISPLPHRADIGWHPADGSGSVASVDPAAEGITYPEASFEVAPEHVARFAAVVGQTEPGVPPTFLTAAEFGIFPKVIADPRLALDFTRVVHGEQEYEWRRPLVLGETLTVRSRISSIRSKGGHGFVTIEADLSDGDGNAVAVARATMIERGE